MDAGEVVVRTTFNAPWLPPGGRAEVVRARVPPAPMCLVRLLIRRRDRVFCVPRQSTGRLDLPTRAVEAGDADGSRSIGLLVEEVTGRSHRTTFIGAVRNIVETTETTYEWPMPLAHFGVWTVESEPLIDGEWLEVTGIAPPLEDRHWYALISG